MSSTRVLAAALRSSAAAGAASPARPALARSFRTSAVRAQDATASSSSMSMPAAAAARRPVGAFRGGLLGFLLGTTAAAYGTYAYVLEEYRMSNEMLTEDLYVRVAI